MTLANLTRHDTEVASSYAILMSALLKELVAEIEALEAFAFPRRAPRLFSTTRRAANDHRKRKEISTHGVEHEAKRLECDRAK